MNSKSAEILQDFFTNNQVAIEATRPIKKGTQIELVLLDDPQGAYHFIKEGTMALVKEGKANKPDFTMTFPPRAIENITALQTDNIAEFGITFFKHMLEEDPDLQVKVKIQTGIIGLTTHGYLKVLALGGVKVMTWLARKGVSGLGGIKKAINYLRGN